MHYTDIAQTHFTLNYSSGFSGKAFDITEPATGKVLGNINAATSDEAAAVIAKCKAAQPQWANTTFETRAGILRRFACQLAENAELIHTWNARECGSIRPKSEWELQACIEQAYMAAAQTQAPSGELYPSVIPGRKNMRVRIPVGVVGVIAPWNFPLLLALRAVLPALAMGNAVVLKPDPQSVITGGVIIQELLAAAGLPESVLGMLPGGAEPGQALVEHNDTGMIAFTGSTAVGRSIAQHCAKTFKKTSLELGGNNAFIVLEDADIASASSCAAWGAFLHQGQICMQSGRHIVHESVAEAYTQALVERANNLYVGNPFTEQCHLGPLINPMQANKVTALINDSVSMGAKVLTDGSRDGQLFRPTVVADVTAEMPLFKEEIFGPVAPIITFKTEQEAISLANASSLGLSASIHTGNSARGEYLAGLIHAGMVHVNDQTVNNEYHIPFGGLKDSGDAGRIGGQVNLDEFTHTKWISVMDKGIQYPF